MAIETLEDRVATVENELMQIKRQLAAEKSQTGSAGWKTMFGIFANRDGFEEATRLGREYREA